MAATVALPCGSEGSDPVSAARRLRERAASLAPVPDAATGITHDVGPIAVIEHDGTDYSRLEPDGTPNYAARARVTQRFYQDHGDLYDFVVVFTNFDFDTAGAVGFHNLVRNDVSGIGLPPVNNGPLFGSPGRLKGYVDMGPVGQYRLPPFSMQPGHPGFGAAVDVLSHEIGHQWIAGIRYRTPTGADSTDLQGLDQTHWSYLLDSDASLFYGSDWVPEGTGAFRAMRVRQRYSALDLYLMGLLDPTKVAPFTLLRNPAVSPYQLPQEGVTVSAVPEAIGIDQVVAAESPRQPDHRASQKDFRVGFLFLASPGADPTAEDLDAVNRLREAFSARFFALTRGVALADTTLAEEPLPQAGPPADLDRALAWLRTRQSLDGRWEDSPGTAVRDTAAALEALDAAAETAGAYERGQAWMLGVHPASLDFGARRASARALEALPPTARSELIASIFTHQNPDGGFGAAQGYESDGFDTALALSALHDLGAPADVRVRNALHALATLQAAEGGWALVPGRAPSTMAIAQVLLALQDWSELPEAGSLLTPALASLTSRQNADGGFGESPSTPHGTALALLALDRTAAPASVVEPATAWLERTQLPEGSWSGRAYETALAIAALRGRTAPNLVVRQDDLAFDPPHPEEGAVVRVHARVRNVGRLPSPTALVRLYDGPPSAVNAIQDVPLPALEPNADAVAILDFDTTGKPGTHLLSVKADADDVVAEVREDDNTASRSLEVEGPLADLVVRVSDIVVAPYPPEAGETVQVTVTVTNRGERDAPSTELRVFRGHPSGQGVAVGLATLPALNAGSSFAATFEWLASGPPASTHLVAVADAAYEVAESDEGNNQAALPVTITGPVGPGPDLEVPLVEVEPSVLTQIPQAVQVRVVVRNLGRDAVASTVAIFDGPPASAALLAELPIALAPRTGTVLVFPLQLTTPGNRTITAVADRAAQVVETNEDNNQASATIVDPGNALDVAIASVTPGAVELTIGQTLTVSAAIRNRGTMPIAQVPVILAHATGTLAELDRELVTLAPGASTTVTLRWTTSLTGDAVPLAVVADPFDLLVESDETNNRWDFTVRVQPSVLPNLRLTGADVTFEPDPPLEGGAAIIRARVANPSPVDAGPFAVRFFLGDPGADGILLGEAVVAGVGHQGSADASLTWAPVDARGTLGVFVVADAAGQVEEYDETDNVAFRPFEVIGLPDLALSSADLTLTPPFPRAGQHVTVRAIVRNLGSRPAEACTLRVFEGEPASGILLAERPIPTLAPGQAAPITIDWTPASVGERLLSALADAEGVVVEADEGNNLGRRHVVVQDADLYTTAPYFSPDGDGIQDETTLAYRTTGPVAILVSDSRGHLVRTLAAAAPPEGAVTWDGRDQRGRLLWDGAYALTLRSQSGAILGRLDVVLDTNRSPIHDAAGTGLVAQRTLDVSQSNARGPAWMPSEDEVLLIIPIDHVLAGLTRGLLRWRLDGARSYVSTGSWYDPFVQFASSDAVAPDGREVLVTKDGAIVAIDLVTGARRAVAPGSTARWSPDGARILIGNGVFARDGTPLASLPFGDGRWSPDGQDLIEGFDLIHRDGTDPRRIPSPVEFGFGLGEPCFLGSTWRGDGRIALHLGRWIEVPQGGFATECRADRVFIHDLATGESEEAAALRGTRYSDQWSPDGSRLLHPAATGEAREVTREVEGPGLQLWPSLAWATPRGSGAFFCEAGPEGCWPYVARLVAITNLLNLTADLTAVPLPGHNGVLIRGTVTDAHLDRWEMDFASTTSATTWHPIGPASSSQVVDGVLATWVPSQPGTYLVRLSAWDRAGGRRIVTRVVSWSQTPALANITQSEHLISPNDDGVKDAVRFDFLVQEPTHLEARVNGPEPPPGTPGQPPDVRHFSLDLPAIGPSALVWDGRDASGQLVADGRYTVFLNEVPFRVDVDATPPEIGIQHDNLRLVDIETIESPGEVRGPTGQCVSAPVQVGVPGLDRHWHVVDPNLKGWYHALEAGTEQIYEPERDANGQIVYVGGVPLVKRLNGRPVDRLRVVADPHWPGTLEAEDEGGNRSSLSSAPVPTELFVIGYRPWPRCLPAGTVIPKNRQLGDGPVKLAPRTRFFVRGAPAYVSAKRFEYRDSEAGPWLPGPVSDVVNDFIVDADLLALGLVPGRSYHGRFVGTGSQGALSDEFLFSLCTESVSIQLEEPQPIPGTNHSRYVVNLEADVSQPLSAADLVVTGSGMLQGFAIQTPFERIGPTSYRKVMVAPTAGCSLSGEQSVLEFQASIRDASGAPLSHDASCLDLKRQVGRCAHALAITEQRLECSVASPDRVVLKVQAQSPDPGAIVTVSRDGASGPAAEPFPIGTEQVCGSLPGPGGAVPLYCDERLVLVDVVGVPEGTALFMGRLDAQPPGSTPLATVDREVHIDRTAPVLTMAEPLEGGVACVERNGLAESVRLVLRVDDAAPAVTVTRLAYRYGNGVWLPMCLDQDCQPWDDLPTGAPLERRWDVRGLVDGEYELRFELCDGSGNRTTLTRRFSITRGGTAIDLVSVVNQDFSPNGDGSADETRVRFRLPQALQVEVTSRAGSATGVVVRHLADQQFSAGVHEFVWDGRTDGGAVTADARYFVVANGTNSCGGMGGTSAWVQLDTTRPVAEISSPASGAVVVTGTDVTGRATDLRFESYALAFGAGLAPSTWTSIAAGTQPVGGTQPGLLGTFQPPPTEGIYTLRLVARDRALNETEARSLVNVGPRAFLERFAVSPAVFSPNGDGRSDTASVEYQLLVTGRVTVDVRAAEGGLLRRLESAVEHPPGLYVLLWDGRLASGALAPEGDHRVVIQVEDPAGLASAQEQAVSLVLDVSPPAVSIAQPAGGAFVAPEQFVHGSVVDARLREYVISAERPFHPAVELARGNQSQLDADLASLGLLTDGPYELVVTAEDAGENPTVVRVPFGLDAITPQALIQSPAPGSVVQGGSAPVLVNGSAQDSHLQRYELAFGPGLAPSYFVPIGSGTQPVASGALGSWPVSGLPDGPYTLRLEVRDLAGHVSESRSTVVLDSRAPDAEIDSPTTDAYLNTSASVTGTASDTNLDSWRLEAAPGEVSTAFQWSLLAEGSTPVVSGTLADWAPLPPDGRHTIRLTVKDRAGHASTRLRTVTVDTVPPIAPAGVTSVVQRDGEAAADITLAWAANTEPDLAGYVLTRNGVTITTGPLTAPTFRDEDLPEGQYVYRLAAVDRAGNASPTTTHSVAVDLTPPTVALLEPSAGARVSGSVEVRGTAFSLDDFVEFRLLAGEGAAPADWTLINRSTVPVSVGLLGTWTPTAAGPHVLALEAEDRSGNEARVTVTVVVDHSPPVAPALLSVVNVPQPDTLTSSWQLVSEPDVIGYLVYRNGRVANAPAVVIGSLRPYLVPGPSHPDTQLPDGAHCYRIVAMDEAGNLSIPSNEICRTLDNRPPHAVLVEPPDGTRFDFPLRLVAFTPDLDVASVRFDVTPAAEASWMPIGPADHQAPYEASLDPQVLAPGTYRVRAVAAEGGGEEDPSPSAITVVYGDATAPASPVGLAASVDGDVVSLVWNAGTEPDLAGYRIYRDGEPLTPDPHTSTSFTEARPLGTYEYAVTSVDADGNESLPSTAEALIYRLTLDPVVPPVADGPLTLTGQGARTADGTVEVVRNGAPIAQAPVGSTGLFSIDGITLVSGPNLFAVRERDASGHASVLSDEAVAIANTAPGPVTGLAANVTGFQVGLAWNPSSDPDAFGYHIRRDGADLTLPAVVATAQQITATHHVAGFGPYGAFDGDSGSAWVPSTVEQPAHWTIELTRPTLVGRVDLLFHGTDGPLPSPAHRVEMEWEGRFLPIVDAPAGLSQVTHALPLPFATSKVRIGLGPATYVGLAEVSILELDVVPADAPSYTETAPDGILTYEVAAVDRYGSRGLLASVQVIVGDVEAPPVPAGLQANVDGSDVALTWQPVIASDLAGYVVLRDGEAIGTSTTPAYLDGGRPNGTYVYSVRSRDTAGNESVDSAPSAATVSVAAPSAPVLSASTPAAGGVLLGWTHPGAPGFVLDRATSPGGPYAAVAHTGDVREHADLDVLPGRAYFYVLRALDAVGNASAPSNQVQATPLAPTPVLLRPTLASQPITLPATSAGFGGRAWPDAMVALTVNGELKGAIEALRAFEEVESRAIPGTALGPCISPDGRTIAYGLMDGAATNTHWVEWATGTVSEAATPAWPGAFSADGRRLTYTVPVCDGPACQADLRLVDLDSADVTNLETGPLDVLGSAWAPTGDRVVIVGHDPATSVNRLAVIDVATGLTTVLVEAADGFAGPRWSPTGDEIAVLRWDAIDQRVEIDVFPAAGGPAQSLDDAVGSVTPVWMPSDRTIVYTSVLGERPRQRAWNLATGAITDLTNGTYAAVDGRVDAAGQRLSYVRFDDGSPVAHALVVRDLATDVERDVVTWNSDFPGVPELHEWVRGGFLAFVLDGRIRLFPSFDGAFHVPSVALAPGVNRVEAEAIEVSTGAISESSEPASVTVPFEVFPDLSVGAAELASYPTLPLVGQAAVVSARVRNLGHVPVSGAVVSLKVQGPAGPVIDQSATVGTIPPGGSTLVSSYWTPPGLGTYLLRAEADPDQQVVESREDNNSASSGIIVVEVEGLSLQVETDRSSYAANTTALLTIEVTNGGAPFAGILRTRVLAPDGSVVALVDERPLSIAYGQVQRTEIAWNTAATLAGEYTFEVQALEGDTVRAQDSRAFQIEPDVEVWMRVTPDDPTVVLGATAVLHVTVENRGANTMVEGASIRVSVAPAAGGGGVFTASGAVPSLQPGAGWEGTFAWSPAAPAGVYAARAEVTSSSGVVLAVWSTPLEVHAATGPELRGTLTLDPSHVLRGAISQATASITNDGPAPVTGHPFVLEVTNGASPAVILSVPFSLDIPAGETQHALVDLPTDTLAAGTYFVFLRSPGSTPSLDRQALYVHSVITPPSLHSPPSGGSVPTSHPALRVNNGFSAGGASLRYEYQLFGDEALTVPLPGTAGVPETPNVTSWTVAAGLAENVRYYWRARATDGFSNSAWTPVASFLVDEVNEPPSAPTPDTPEPNTHVTTLQPTLIVANGFDPEMDPLTYDFRLAADEDMTQMIAAVAGLPQGPIRTAWPVPVALVENARYYWSARARDAQGASAWTVPIAFLADVENESPSPTPLLRPEDDAEVLTQTPELAAGEASDPEGDPLVYRIEVDRVPTFDSPLKQVSPLLPPSSGEAAWTPPLPLADNAHAYWRGSAYDGHSSGPWSYRRFFVNLANDPPAAPVPLDPGAGSVVTTQTPVLRVQNATDLDLDLLSYTFEVHDTSGALVASAAGIPQSPGQTIWQVGEPLTENGEFTWRSRAHDGEANGPWSADTSFRVNSTNDPPTAPSLVAPPPGATVTIPRPELIVANAVSPDQLPLSYRFEVYRDDGSGSTLVMWADGVPSGATNTSWTPTEDLPDATYSWRARAADVNQPGPWMASAAFTVAVDVAPAPPTGLSAVAGDQRVDLAWSASPEPDVTGYRVYRSDIAGGPHAFVAATAAPSYADTGLPNGQALYYVVTAVDASFESDPSPEVSATPMAAPLAAEVVLWPPLLDGECLVCPPRESAAGPPAASGAQPVTPVLECVRSDGPVGITAFFGYDNPNAAAVDRPIGPQNFFDPPPADRGQPSSFARGRSPGYPGDFQVPLGEDTLTWWLDGLEATASPLRAVKNCPIPPLACPDWLYATIEPPVGYDPAAIDPASVRLAGVVAADPTYQALVDRDGDGRMEREVRFSQAEVRPLLEPGNVPLTVDGVLGAHTFAGGSALRVAAPKARLEFWPSILVRSQPGPPVRAWLTLRGCFGGAGVDVTSIRFNGVVPVAEVLGIEGGVLKLTFDRDAVLAVLPLGVRVEVAVTGTAQGQSFRAVDLVQVIDQGAPQR